MVTKSYRMLVLLVCKCCFGVLLIDIGCSVFTFCWNDPSFCLGGRYNEAIELVFPELNAAAVVSASYELLDNSITAGGFIWPCVKISFGVVLLLQIS